MQLLINPYGGFGTKTISSLMPDEITNDAPPSSAHSTQFKNFHRSHGLRGNYSFDALRHIPLERFRLHSHAGAWERWKLQRFHALKLIEYNVRSPSMPLI